MIQFNEIENAYLFVSSAEHYMNSAFLNIKTGEIYYYSELTGENELPEDIESDDYIEIPHKNDLDLGARLVFDFVSEYIPEKYEQVRDIFRRKGAYRRYKYLLDSLGMLQKWYEYEDQRTKAALLEWCKENGLEVE